MKNNAQLKVSSPAFEVLAIKGNMVAEIKTGEYIHICIESSNQFYAGA